MTLKKVQYKVYMQTLGALNLDSTNKAFEIINATMLARGPLLLGKLSYLIPECGWNSLTIIVCVAGRIMLLGGVITKFFVKG